MRELALPLVLRTALTAGRVFIEMTRLLQVAFPVKKTRELCVPKTSHGDFRVKGQKIISA
jgi:hypothetical protein